jgi:PilZ domain-containing protein
MNLMEGSAWNEAGMRDRRKTERMVPCLKGAYIVFDQTRIDCVVRNESEGGVCLQVPSIFGIPDIFILQMKSSDDSYPCRVVWRSIDHIGAEFL